MISLRDRPTSLLSLCQDEEKPEDPRRIWQSFHSTFPMCTCSKLHTFFRLQEKVKSYKRALYPVPYGLGLSVCAIIDRKRTTARWKSVGMLSKLEKKLWTVPSGVCRWSVERTVRICGSQWDRAISRGTWRQCVGAKVANNRWHDRVVLGHPRSPFFSFLTNRNCLGEWWFDSHVFIHLFWELLVKSV